MHRLVPGLVAAALLASGGGAHAESGRLNLHANAAFTAVSPLALGVMGNGGLDWQFRKPYAIDVNLGGGNFTLFTGAVGRDTELFHIAAGMRFRFFDNEQGYHEEVGGDQWGNWFVAPRVGFLLNVTSGQSFAIAEVETGYEFSVASPLQVGPFVRAGVAFGPSEFGYFLAGVEFSIEIFPIRTPRAKPRPREEPVEPGDDDSGLPDTDEDGVPDATDACPGTRLGSIVDARGCVVLAAQMVLEGITFAFDSADIQPASEEALIRAAQSLRDNPTAHVEIDGHTDAVGTEAYNARLSEARARAVADWLIAHGIDGGRLTVRGFGTTRPKAPNDSEANRALNRRIEFRRLDVP